MGASDSRPSSTYVDSPENEKSKLFTTIFVRLLKETDIVDLHALTKGPGACGSYVVLLEKELNKEFKQLKLQSSVTGAKAVNSFLYSKAKDIETETAADSNACRELAIFYIRLLQLVGALTMSIYTPGDLIDRIRNRVLQASLKKQQKNLPVSLEEKESRRLKTWEWFRTYIISSVSGVPGVYTLKDKTNYKFNKENNTLTYTTADGLKYDATLALYEMDKYNIDASVMKPDSYWIVLIKPKEATNIFRILVHKEGSGYLFSPNEDKTVEEEKPILYYKDWSTDLGSTMASTLAAEKVSTGRNNSRNRDRDRSSSRNRPLELTRGTEEELRRAGVSLTNLNRLTRRGGARTMSRDVFGYRTSRNDLIGSSSGSSSNRQTNRKNRNAPKPAETSTLPKQFQEIYNFMTRWNSEISSWTEASPATYRSVLLYVKPGLSNLAATSYFCVDNWSQKTLRYIPPFAALESLYFNEDDGTASISNQAALSRLVEEFKTIYSTVSSNKSRSATSFADVILPPLPEQIKAEFCKNKTSQGDIIVDSKNAQILETAQLLILEKYKKYFDTAFTMINRIFEVKTDIKGNTRINFTPAFANSSAGARATLEEIIATAREMIAIHYIEVETIYQKAIRDLSPVLQR